MRSSSAACWRLLLQDHAQHVGAERHQLQRGARPAKSPSGSCALKTYSPAFARVPCHRSSLGFLVFPVRAARAVYRIPLVHDFRDSRPNTHGQLLTAKSFAKLSGPVRSHWRKGRHAAWEFRAAMTWAHGDPEYLVCAAGIVTLKHYWQLHLLQPHAASTSGTAEPHVTARPCCAPEKRWKCLHWKCSHTCKGFGIAQHGGRPATRVVPHTSSRSRPRIWSYACASCSTHNAPLRDGFHADDPRIHQYFRK